MNTYHSIIGTEATDTRLQVRQGLKRQHLLLALCVLAMISSIVLWVSYFRMMNSDYLVSIKNLQISQVERVEFHRDVSVRGQIVAGNSPTVFSSTNGIIRLEVASGETVKKGQILARIENPALSESFTKESLMLEKLKLDFDRKKASYKNKKIELERGLELALINFKAAERNARRAKTSFDISTISQQDYEDILDKLERAKLEYQLAKQNIVVSNQEAVFEHDIGLLEIENQQVHLKSVERQIDELSIKSPVLGVVGKLLVRNGAAVQSNQALINTVGLRSFEITAKVSERYADDLLIGLKVEIYFLGEQYKGELSSISPEVDNQQINIRIRFVDSLPKRLHQNQQLLAKIILESGTDRLLIDKGKFLPTFDGTIFKISGSTAQRVPIKLGKENLLKVEIVEGLEEGDRVIVAMPDSSASHPILTITD